MYVEKHWFNLLLRFTIVQALFFKDKDKDGSLIDSILKSVFPCNVARKVSRSRTFRDLTKYVADK